MSFYYNGPILKLENVSLSFGNKTILKDVSFEVQDIVRPQTTGQVITLLGRSGIGKTQLMKMIAGLQRPSSGSIKLGLSQKEPEKGKVGMVLQNYPLFEHRTVKSNITLVSKGMNRSIQLCEELDVIDHIDKYPSQLSGGQRQRVAIIQQILSSERFVLLDEPFSGLDPLATKKLSLNIRKLADNHSENTIVISSHILEPSIAVSDTVIMLSKVPNQEYASVGFNANLVQMGLAYKPDIMDLPEFHEFCNFVRKKFE